MRRALASPPCIVAALIAQTAQSHPPLVSFKAFQHLRAAPRLHRADSVRRIRGNAGETEARKSFHNRRVSPSLPSHRRKSKINSAAATQEEQYRPPQPLPLRRPSFGDFGPILRTAPHTPTHLIFLASGDKAATMASQWPTPISAAIGDGRNAHFTVLPSGPSSSNRTYPNPNTLVLSAETRAHVMSLTGAR